MSAVPPKADASSDVMGSPLCADTVAKLPLKATVAAVSMVVLSTSVQAADLADVPYDVPSFDWSGFYGGVHVGYAFGDTRVTPLNGGESSDAEGVFGGGQIGYNIQSGAWVFGIEADGAGSGIENDGQNGGPLEGFVDLQWLATFRGRVGYAADNTLFYATGGLALAGIEYTDFDVGPTPNISKTHLGFAIGGGVEYMFADGFSGKLEYLYVDLDDETYDIGDPDSVDFDGHFIKVGINYHF